MIQQSIPEFCRLEDGVRKTSAIRMRNAHGVTITLIGMCHLGIQKYYDLISEYIADSPGIVLREGSGYTRQESFNSEDHRLLCRTTWDLFEARIQTMQLLDMDIVMQGDVLEYPHDRTVSADFSVDEAVEALRKNGYDFSKLRPMLAQEEEERRRHRDFLDLNDGDKMGLRGMYTWEEIRKHLSQKAALQWKPSDNHRRRSQFVDDTRNARIMEVADSYLPSQSLIIPWGNAHILPLIEEFRRRGFEIEDGSIVNFTNFVPDADDMCAYFGDRFQIAMMPH